MRLLGVPVESGTMDNTDDEGDTVCQVGHPLPPEEQWSYLVAKYLIWSEDDHVGDDAIAEA